MAVDAFGFPVLYYVANDQARWPFSDLYGGSIDQKIGRYRPLDNAQFTGCEFVEPGGPSFDGFDLGAGPVDGSQYHWLYNLGWQVDHPAEEPLPNTFASFFYDQDVFNQQQVGGAGRVWPHNPETFVFISSGPDAVYGSNDDVTNY